MPVTSIPSRRAASGVAQLVEQDRAEEAERGQHGGQEAELLVAQDRP